jgi:hypothetical protein
MIDVYGAVTWGKRYLPVVYMIDVYGTVTYGGKDMCLWSI